MSNKKVLAITLLLAVVVGLIYAQVRPQQGRFGLTGTNMTLEFRGNNITLRDGNNILASGTFRVEGNILIYNFSGGAGAGDMTIVNATRLEDSRGTWHWLG